MTKIVIGISSQQTRTIYALVQKQFGNYKRNELFRTQQGNKLTNRFFRQLTKIDPLQ